MAGLDVMTGVMIVVSMRHRANDAEVIREPSQLRQVLADAQGRGPRSDRPERPADAARRFRLHVERFELAGSAEEIQEDHGLRPRSSMSHASTTGLRGPD